MTVRTLSLLSSTKHGLKTLPSFLHLMFFLLVVILAVLSLNFEVFRVIRFGDLLIMLIALLVGIHWYGQKMLEAGYNEGKSQKKEDISDSYLL